MQINKHRAISTRQLSYNAGRFTADASDLQLSVVAYPLYDDACDQGIWVQSHTTGKMVPFLLDRVDRDQDDDVVGWQYRAYYNGHAYVLTIFND